MTADLVWLAWTALLTALLWIPYILGTFATKGVPTPKHYIDVKTRTEGEPAWVVRAFRTHQNSVEAFAPFAALVLIAHEAGLSGAETALWALVFFWARVAHAVVFLLGIPYLRTLAFAVGLVATLMMFRILIA